MGSDRPVRSVAPKIISAILTLLVNLGVGLLFFAVLILALNGYSGSDAAYGIGAFVILGMLVALGLAIGAFFSVGFLQKREMRPFAAVALSVIAFCLVGAALSFLAMMLAVGVAEIVRVN